MQRLIKFRVWDTQNEEFSEWTNRDPFFSTSEGKLFFWERTKKEDGSYGGDIILEDHGDRFVLQQFTGLLDKNGKEIYEGDIVSVNDNFNQTQIGKIEWGIYSDDEYVNNLECWMLLGKRYESEDDDYFEESNAPLSIICRSNGVSHGRGLKTTNGTIKIIGNIFQTSELLK